MTKPEPLMIDNEVFEAIEDGDLRYVWFHRGSLSLSPCETEELRNWLTKVLEWIYDEDR